MFLQRLLRPGPARAAGERLYAADGGPGPLAGALRASWARRTRRTADSRSTRCMCCWCWTRLRARGRQAAAAARPSSTPISAASTTACASWRSATCRSARPCASWARPSTAAAKALDAALAALPDRGPLDGAAGAHRAAAGRAPTARSGAAGRLSAARRARRWRRRRARAAARRRYRLARPLDCGRGACLGRGGLLYRGAAVRPAGTGASRRGLCRDPAGDLHRRHGRRPRPAGRRPGGRPRRQGRAWTRASCCTATRRAEGRAGQAAGARRAASRSATPTR